MEGVFVYLIQDLNGGYYTGISRDVKKRLKEHNSGKVKATTRRRPLRLVYYKRCANYVEAREQEKWLKKKNRKYKSSLVF